MARRFLTLVCIGIAALAGACEQSLESKCVDLCQSSWDCGFDVGCDPPCVEDPYRCVAERHAYYDCMLEVIDEVDEEARCNGDASHLFERCLDEGVELQGCTSLADSRRRR